MKKKVIALASIVICLAIMAVGTLAYFTDEHKVHNIITTNGVDIAIEEWQDKGNGELVPYPKDKPVKVMPGVTVSKIATIKNFEAESYVRAKFEVVVLKADGSRMDITQEELAKVIKIEVNGAGEKWIRKDGDVQWWYYNDSLDTKASTEALFTEVVFDGPNMGNEYQNCQVQVIVVAQGVQVANNGGSVLEAAGWPAE